MNTEKHYADGGEPHYKRVARLGLSWCRANITKYAERTKGTPTDDLIKIADYALMELESTAIIATSAQYQKLVAVQSRVAQLATQWGSKPQDPSFAASREHTLPTRYEHKQSAGMGGIRLDDGSDPVARGYVNQDEVPYKGNQEARK